VRTNAKHKQKTNLSLLPLFQPTIDQAHVVQGDRFTAPVAYLAPENQHLAVMFKRPAVIF
jgi:hypothetical protein